MKRLIASLLLFIPLALLIVGINYLVDPANIFHSDVLVQSVFDATASGMNADGVSNYNDRLFVEKRIQAMTKAPSYIVLGSSHGAQIDSNIAGADLYNSCVTGATLEDVTAIYEIYSENEIAAKTVILCVDAWFFDPNREDERCRLYIPEYYESFIRKHIDESFTFGGKTSSDLVAIYKELISPSYFQSSFASIVQNGYSAFTDHRATPTDSPITDRGMVKSDGSYVYPQGYINASESEMQTRVSDALPAIVATLAESGGIDENMRAVFEALVSSILADGSEIILVESPYHPAAYGAVCSDPNASAALSEVSAYLEAFSADNGITLIGSYDPAALGLSGDDFIDALHLNYEATDELISENLN